VFSIYHFPEGIVISPESKVLEKHGFEEYKLLRDTVSHFDKILVSLRRNAIYFAFTIFAVAITALTLNIPSDLPYNLKKIDLSIALIIIDLLVILSFLYLEDHYRYYLLKIVEVATEYEKELGLGVKLKECDQYNPRDYPNCHKLASISKCLKCLHDNGMEKHIRAAHFNIYALLLALGFVALNGLIFVRIDLSFKEFFLSMILILLVVICSPILYVELNIKKQKANCEFDNNSLYYILSIFLFMLLMYLFYFFIFNADKTTGFIVSCFVAFLISAAIFLVLVFPNKISKIMSSGLEILKTYLTMVKNMVS